MTLYLGTNKIAGVEAPIVDQTFDGTSTNAQSGVSILGLLETIYPVGALYIGTTSTCPMSTLFGTWELVSSGKALWTGDGTNADTTIAAGLPNLYGTFAAYAGSTYGNPDGVFTNNGSNYNYKGGNSGSSYGWRTIGFNASTYNSIYSDDATTVQPPAYVVNVWKRTA